MNSRPFLNDLRVSILSTINAPQLGYVLRSILERGIRVDSVLCDPLIQDERMLKVYQERTRGMLEPVPLEEFEALRIPFFFVANHCGAETVSLIRERAIDLLVNAGTPRILKNNLIQAPTLGVLGCHPGLLPEFRGCTSVEWAVYLDEQVGGTAFFVSEDIDLGPIVLRRALTFDKGDRYPEVRVKALRNCFELMGEGVKKIIEEGLDPRNMDVPQGGQYYEVMDDERMAEVARKLERGEYRYQL